jgi:arylsulfatase A-like enzyme
MKVLFILADALRADRLHCCGNPWPTSPTIDRLAAEGVRFTNVIANANHTVPGLVSAFTGLYVTAHGIRDQASFSNWCESWRGRRTPFHVLRENGYQVAGDDPEFYCALGFERNGRDVNATLGQLAQQEFFLWHRSEETHLPYDPPPPWDTAFLPPKFVISPSLAERLQVVRKSLLVHKPGLVSKLESGARDAIERDGYQRTVGIATFTPEERPALLALYDGCVRMLDQEIAGYLGRLRELGILEDTLIVVSSDHGEQLLERGAVGHSSCSLEGNLYDENLRIPLLLHCPALLPRGRTIQRQVSQVDIMPTIVELLGLSMPGPVAGRSLVPLIHGRATDFVEEAYAETAPCGWQALDTDRRMMWCVRRPPWKLVRYHDPQNGDRAELFNIQLDAGEQHNGLSQPPEIGAGLDALLDRWCGIME